MKYNKICPKCNSKDILRIHGTEGGYGVNNQIRLGFTNFSSVLIQRYVCMECGYSEEWIAKGDLEYLRDKLSE